MSLNTDEAYRQIHLFRQVKQVILEIHFFYRCMGKYLYWLSVVQDNWAHPNGSPIILYFNNSTNISPYIWKGMDYVLM